MQQHAAAKRAHPDSIVFFRLGDFYEMFGDDAVRVARLLDLTLTSRNKGKPDEVPMAGVPHHAAHGYIARLLSLGEKVAICEQMADPAKTKGIVPREVVRVITPGTVTQAEHLDSSTNNWLCAIELGPGGPGIALLDISTGQLRAAGVSDLSSVLGELSQAAPREVLIGHHASFADAAPDAVSALSEVARGATVRVDVELPESDRALLGELLHEAAQLAPNVACAVTRAVRYAARCYPGRALPVRRISIWEPAAHLRIDASAQAHLELVQTLSGGKQGSLLSVIDQTKTAFGARLLRQRLLSPLVDTALIRRRLDQVEAFVSNGRLRAELRKVLAEMTDLERIAVRVSMGEASPRDLGALRDGLGASARATELLSTLRDEAFVVALGLSSPPDVVEDLHAELSRALVPRPPAQAKEGAIFQLGFDPELDELDELRKRGTEHIVAFEGALRERSGISGLRVKFTRVFGWYIEVTRSQVGKVPSDFRRKQTVAGGERYSTDELDELAERIASAEERHRERELELLRKLVERAAREVERVRALALCVADWDVAAALGEVAVHNDYTRPEVDDSDQIEIRDGRHPVVERLSAAGRFVPNDLSVSASLERLWLITGPNMAGKSTFLRQSALIVLLAQMGSYVPARYARVGVVDRVLSRVGASDNLAAGESTFMVEMRETAQILRYATARSLVILDEIGRGTSTFDGLAIAWAVAEYLDEIVGCRALFATHYHELTELGESSPHCRNYSVSARELADDVVFLHRLVPGAASRSYGVAVAKLAGLPEPVLARARALLGAFESESREAGGRPTTHGGHSSRGRQQLDLFGAAPAPKAQQDVVETLRSLELDRLTGLEALSLLHQLKNKLS